MMGVPVNFKQVCFSAQFNVAIIATRFAVRSLSDARNLIFCSGVDESEVARFRGARAARAHARTSTVAEGKSSAQKTHVDAANSATV